MKRKNTGARIFYKILSNIVTILMIPAVLLALYACFLMFKSQKDGTAVSIFGYSPVRVLSGSMVASGFEINEVVMIKDINTKALKVGDIIAFYVYTRDIPASVDPYTYDVYVAPDGISERAPFTFDKFIGNKNELQTAAGKAHESIWFHKIVDIRIDDEGKLWIKTWGTSNKDAYGTPIYDSFWTREDLVVGKYAEISPFLSTCLGFLGSNTGIVFLVIIPLGILLIILAIQFIDAYDRYSMEKKIRKDAIKVTDKLSVKKQIGYDLSSETKIMVLNNEKDNLKKQEAINLMWKKEESPKPIIKYIKKQDWREREEQKYKQRLAALQDLYKATKNPKYINEYQRLKEEFSNKDFRKLVNASGEVVQAGNQNYFESLPRDRAKELKKQAAAQKRRDARLLKKNNKLYKKLRKREEREAERERLHSAIEKAQKDEIREQNRKHDMQSVVDGH